MVRRSVGVAAGIAGERVIGCQSVLRRERSLSERVQVWRLAAEIRGLLKGPR